MSRHTISVKNKIGNAANPIPILLLGSEAVESSRKLGCKLLWTYNSEMNYLEHHINKFNTYFNNYELYCSIGFDSESFLKKYSYVKHIENLNYEVWNDTYDIRLFLNCVQPKHCIIASGNYEINFELNRCKLNQSMTSGIVGTHKDLGLSVNNNNLLKIDYGYNELAWSQFIYLGQEETSLLHGLIINKKYDHYYLFEIVNLLINHGGKLEVL